MVPPFAAMPPAGRRGHVPRSSWIPLLLVWDETPIILENVHPQASVVLHIIPGMIIGIGICAVHTRMVLVQHSIVFVEGKTALNTTTLFNGGTGKSVGRAISTATRAKT